MLKRVSFLFLFALLVLCLVVTFGCSNRPATETNESGVDNEQVFELKYNDWGPETIYPGQAALRAISQIEEKTGGKVKITPYFSASLIENQDTYQGLAAGVADISYMACDRFVGIHDFNLIFERLFEEEAPDVFTIHQIYREMLDKYPELQEEMATAGTRWLDVLPLPQNHMHTVSKPIRNVQDVKGMRFIAQGDIRDWLELMGGAGLGIGPGDWYMSLDRGLVDGQIGHWQGMDGFGTLDCFSNHTLFGEGGINVNTMGFQINLNTWNSLPAEYQKIIEDAFREAAEWNIEQREGTVERMEKEAEEKGHTFIRISSEERQEWAEYMKTINNKWIEETEAKGWPAREAFEDLMTLFREHK